MDIYTLPDVKQIASGKQQHSIGRSAQGSVTTEGGWEGDPRGRGYGDICIPMADSLCCAVEINTAL